MQVNDLFLDFLWWPGSFSATSAGKVDQICDSCIISSKSEATPTQSITVEAGYVLNEKKLMIALILLGASLDSNFLIHLPYYFVCLSLTDTKFNIL